MGLILAAVGLIVYDLRRSSPGRLDLIAQAELIRVNTTAALEFRDAGGRREPLPCERRAEISAASLFRPRAPLRLLCPKRREAHRRGDPCLRSDTFTATTGDALRTGAQRAPGTRLADPAVHLPPLLSATSPVWPPRQRPADRPVRGLAAPVPLHHAEHHRPLSRLAEAASGNASPRKDYQVRAAKQAKTRSATDRCVQRDALQHSKSGSRRSGRAPPAAGCDAAARMGSWSLRHPGGYHSLGRPRSRVFGERDCPPIRPSPPSSSWCIPSDRST